jgi:hypothetical protein
MQALREKSKTLWKSSRKKGVRISTVKVIEWGDFNSVPDQNGATQRHEQYHRTPHD